jgi:hypothetical protein
VSEPWATPDTIHDRTRTARARSEALRLVCEHPRIRAVLEEHERPRHMAPEQFETLVDNNRQALDGSMNRCREVLTQLEIPRWQWLVTDLFEILLQRLMPAVLPDSATLEALARDHPDHPATKALLDWAAEQPDLLADAPSWAPANLARRTDAVASERLRQALSLPEPVRDYVKDWSSSLAHEDVDRWAASAHQAISDASGPPIPTSPGKRIGQVEQWVGWWYRSQVLHDEISKIAREAIGATGATNNRAYVRKRIDEVVDLLSGQGGPDLPLRVTRGNASRLARLAERGKRILGEGDER